MIRLIPLRKLTQTVAQGGRGLETEILLQGGGVGIGDGDIAGLHGDELLVGLEVVVGGEDAGAEEFFLEDGDEVEEVLGIVVADVIDHVGRDGQAVLAVLLLGGMLHHADHALDDVVHVGEVALAVAVVENLDGLAADQFVGEAEVGHVGAAGGSIDGEEAQTRGGDVVEFGVGMGHQFVALLGGGIETNGVVHLVVR